MKKLIVCFLLSAIALFADVTGKWTGTGRAATTDGDNEALSIVMELKQSGNDITGSVMTGDSGERYSISNGSIDGDALKLDVAANETTYHVSLKVDGDKMTGEATGENNGAKVTVKLEFKRES